MNTDNYDYRKSTTAQSPNAYSPYVSKDSNNYINDLNSGQYSSTQSLCQINLSSLFNSSRWTNTNDLFLTIPITMVCCTSAGPTTAPAANSFPSAGWGLMSLKSGFHNLIHSADLVINGTTVTDTQPFNGIYNNIRLLSELSQNDLKAVGSSIGFSTVLDTHQSKRWGGAGGTGTFGNGLTNNVPFGPTSQIEPGKATIPGVTGQQPGYQNNGLCNQALNERVLKVFDTSKDNTSVGGTNIVGNIVSGDRLKAEFKPTFEITNDGRYGVIYDLAVIRLKDILDVCSSIGIIKRLGQAMLRLYINTGSLQVNVATPDNAVSGYSFSVINSSFQNACPFFINNLGVDEDNGGIKAGNNTITAGLFIGRALQTNGVNLSSEVTSASHNMSSVRLYYSSLVLEPDKALFYSRTNSAKQIVYKNYYFNQINAVGPGATQSQLIQSGIRNPYALIIVPFISSTFTTTLASGAVGGVSGYQWQSPFDDLQGSPCILSQLQVQLGGQQVLSNPYNYSFETYLTEYSNCESLSSSDFGVSCGLVSKEHWEQNRIYYVNLSRGTKSDNNTPRNIVINFKNDSLCPIDVMVFTVFIDDFIINVDNGMITKTTPLINT